MENEKGFYWEPHAEVEAMFLSLLGRLSEKNTCLRDFENRLLRQTSSRILDWVDHLIILDSKEIRGKLEDLGFKRQEDIEAEAFSHPGVLLPAIVLADAFEGPDPSVALRVDSIDDFLQANGLNADIEGRTLSPFRRALVSTENGAALWVVERRGTRGYEPIYPDDEYFQDYVRGIEAWNNIPRADEDEDKVFTEISRVAGDLIAKFGVGLAAHIVCLCERDYWLSRNFAGRVQKKRQDALGVGWGNHDHHTFRSSRRHFSKLVNFFLQLGFHKRERFYAGKEAGWGAQVMEHSTAGLALFLDVDLAPEEMDIDFSAQELEEREVLGTVGLWCDLHGDSILKAGMHHLAARFEFERLIADVTKHDVRFMAPFSDFPYLKQAFSAAEMWKVAPARVERLLEEKLISDEQAGRFLDQGSVGSHIENIERREGYKGFNKKNVSVIILETDPRKA